ncbi:MAG TPA: DPP IV N-terminal domain-containing protein, partial [Candidatus Bathyarchaeia archaeon]
MAILVFGGYYKVDDDADITSVCIAFNSDRSGNDDIYLMDVEGGNVVRLTKNADVDYWPSWSPDGQKVAYTSIRAGNCDIYVSDLSGTIQVRLTEDAG